MKPLVTFGDAERAVVDYFDGAYTGSLASSKPNTIDTRPPQGPLAAGQTWLQVTLDGSFDDDAPGTERATVRVVLHAGPGRRSDAKAGASLALGLLAIHPGDAVVYGTKRLIGRSQVITDPDTKNVMVWGTLRVDLRPTVITV